MDTKKKVISIIIFLTSIIVSAAILTSCMGIGPFGSRQIAEHEESVETNSLSYE